MISRQYAQTMARYNAWQNRSLYEAATGLSDAERKKDREVFWGSIDATLRHILWADQQWMSRYTDLPAPEKLNEPVSDYEVSTWEGLKRARVDFDKVIEDWTIDLLDSWLSGDLTWRSGISGEQYTRPRWYVVTHMFNHQTHHRGQVHGMLTAAGIEPEDTDLPFMPDWKGL